MPPASLTFPGADVISTGTAMVELDSTGAFSVSLIATDAAGGDPADWTYTVTEKLHQAPGRTYPLALPSATPVVDLADIAPTDPSQGEYVVITGPAGPAGSQIYSGTGAPSAVLGVAGDYYIDTTPGAVQIYGPRSSTAWPSTPIVLQGLTGWLNVRLMGAKGDGTTDDTAAIQAAIDLAAVAGGVVYFPSGTYVLSDALVLQSGVSLRGDGATASVLTQTSTTDNVLSGVDVQQISVTSLGIDGPGTGSGSGIHLTVSSSPNTPYLTLEDLRITGMGAEGISAELPIVSAIRRTVVEDCGTWGFDLFGQTSGGQPPGTSCVLESCYANGCGSGGFNLFKLAYCTLTGCAADGNPIGYLMDTAYAVTMTGCGAEGNTTAGVRISGGYGATLNGLFVYNNLGIGIHVTGSAHIVSLSHVVDVTPGGTATKFIQVDAGSYATILGMSNTTANALNGSVNIVDDGANGAVFSGYTYVGNSLEVAQDIFADSNVSIGTVGKGLKVKEGTNAKMGVATLTAGAATVANTSVAATSRVFLTCQTPGGTPGFLRVSARTAGTSFTITSSSSTDTSTVAWWIVDPA
ncbi:glycosyl hydrolase family 28-related protein [Streptomyces sp. NPDC026672]